jgi:hypothetical protein
MAATADIRKILDRVLPEAGFTELPSGGTATRWWKHIRLASDPDRSAVVIVTILPGRRLGEFTIVPDLRLDTLPFSPQNAPAVFTGSLPDWLDRQLAFYPALAEIEDFYHREVP